jgi:galactokinase
MIIGTVTLLMLYFGGGGMFSFEKAFEPFVKDAVKEKARYEQIVDLTKQADEDLAQFRKEVGEVWAEDLKKLLDDYDATEEQFHSFVEKADRSRTAVQQELLDVRFGVRTLMTEDEWNSMYQAIEEKVEEERKKREEKGK